MEQIVQEKSMSILTTDEIGYWIEPHRPQNHNLFIIINCLCEQVFICIVNIRVIQLQVFETFVDAWVENYQRMRPQFVRVFDFFTWAGLFGEDEGYDPVFDLDLELQIKGLKRGPDNQKTANS